MSKNRYVFIGLAMLISFQSLAQLTNHVQIISGKYFELVDDSSGTPKITFDADEKIYYVLDGDHAQGIATALLPKEQSFIFTLHDKSGSVVPKTALGIENSNQPDKPKIKFYISHFDELFTPNDFFVITNKGFYNLDVEIRVWTKMTNGQYGIVISPPVRVQIEKR